MRQILSRSLLTAAAASSIIAVTGGYAYADSGAQGEAQGSPGILSGNSVDIPLDAPVNACGNTVDAVGLLNPTFGNSCGNEVAPATPQASTPTPDAPPAPRNAPPREAPPTPLKQQVTPPAVSHPTQDPAVSSGLAETGVSGGELGAAAATSAALLVGGAMLYRRAARQSRMRRTLG